MISLKTRVVAGAIAIYSFASLHPLHGAAPYKSQIAELEKKNQELQREINSLRNNGDTPKAEQPPKNTAQSTKTKTESSVVPETDSVRMEPVAVVLDRLILRESVFSEKSLNNPARLTWVRPGSGPESYSIDAGLAAFLFAGQLGSWTADIKLGGEYHRNTASTDPKDSSLFGLRADVIAGNVEESPFTVSFDGSAFFKTDNVKDVQSVEGTLEALPIIAALRIGTLNPVGSKERPWLKWEWQPFIGVLYEGSTDTKADVEKGHRFLLRYGAELQIYPLFGWVRDRVEITARYTAWNMIDSNGLYGKDSWSSFYNVGLHYNFQSEVKSLNIMGVSIPTDQPRKISVGLLYENGDDPELGRTHIDQLTLSLEAQF